MLKGLRTAWALTVCVAAPALSAAPAGETENAASELEALEAIVQRLNALETWIDAADERLASQQKRLANADRSIAEVAQRTRALRLRIDAAEANLATLATERETLDERRRRQAERVAEHLRAAWRQSGHAAARTLLNQEDPALADRMIHYHGYFAKARAATIVEFHRMLAALDDNAQALRQERNALQAARQSLSADRATLLQERTKRQELIRGLRTNLSDRNQERQQLEASRQRLAALIADLERQADIAAVPPGSGLGAAGELPWPVSGQVHRRFGEARAGGRMRWHGMVIQAPLGSEVRAVAAGQVVFADWLRGFGLLAIVDHGDDHMSLYGYADALYKRAGDRVEGGEAIAAVGQSGGQVEVGLYFEIRQAGNPIDPRQWLQSRVAN